MGISLRKEHLQTSKYTYSWTRVGGDGKYIGPLDRNKVSKREGYEVKEFIENLMNKHGLNSTGDVKAIEDALHNPNLRSVVMRADLISSIERTLGLGR